MLSTPTMNPIKCRNGEIVAAFEVTENETVLESKNTWDLRPISPSDLETTVITDDREWSALEGVDLLAGFSKSRAPTRKWLFFQDILMLERLSRDILSDNYKKICDGIVLYMANNPFALMRSCFVEGGEWNAYAIRLPARNGKHFFWIKGAPKLKAEDSRYEMIRWLGLAAEFETSIERKDLWKKQSKMTGKQRTLLLVKRELGNGCTILINQEYDHLRVDKRNNHADIIEIKTWQKGEKEATKEINNSSFYFVSKLLDLEVVVLWNKKSPSKPPWKKCLVESTKKYRIEPTTLTPKNQDRLNEGNEAVRQLVNALHRTTAEVTYFTIKNKRFTFTPSTLKEFVEDLEGESKIGDYVKMTIDELKRHHQNAKIRPAIERTLNVVTPMNGQFNNGVQGNQKSLISYATVVKKREETNKEVVRQENNGVDQHTVQRFGKGESKLKAQEVGLEGNNRMDQLNVQRFVKGESKLKAQEVGLEGNNRMDQLNVQRFVKGESKLKDQMKEKSELDKQNDNGKASRAANNLIVNGLDRMTTCPTSYAEAATKRSKNMAPPENKTFDFSDENNFPLLGKNIVGK